MEFRSSRWIYQALLILAPFVTGCVSVPDTESGGRYVVTEEIPELTSIALVPSDESTAIGSPRNRARHAEKGADVGAYSGMAAGSLMALAMCVNPATMMVCIPALIAGGGVAGAITGGTFAYKGLSKEDQLYVSTILSQIDQDRDLQKQMMQKLADQEPSIWSSVEEAEVHVLADLEKIDLVQEDDDLGMTFNASLVFAWTEDRNAKAKAARVEFRTESAVHDIDSWLNDDGKRFGLAIDNAITELARLMAAYLIDRGAADPADPALNFGYGG